MSDTTVIDITTRLGYGAVLGRETHEKHQKTLQRLVALGRQLADVTQDLLEDPHSTFDQRQVEHVLGQFREAQEAFSRSGVSGDFRSDSQERVY